MRIKKKGKEKEIKSTVSVLNKLKKVIFFIYKITHK